MERHFGLEDGKIGRDYVAEQVEARGWNPDDIDDGVVLGSGLGAFAKNHLEDPLEIPFMSVFHKIRLGAEHMPRGNVDGHAQRLIIGPLKGSTDRRLVMAQSGREHPYEGISSKRAVYWIRLMQLLGVKTLIGSNAAGIVTPRTLKTPSLMLVQSHIDWVRDNPLIGPNEPELGPRFPHSNGMYPKETRDLIKRVAAQRGIALPEGVYIRSGGPFYESPTEVYKAREEVEGIYRQGSLQKDETDYTGGAEAATGMLGMSSTYEALAIQSATQANPPKDPNPSENRSYYPAFQDGWAYISVATNYAAGLAETGHVGDPNHEEVQENARQVAENFEQLVRASIEELRKAS